MQNAHKGESNRRHVLPSLHLFTTAVKTAGIYISSFGLTGYAGMTAWSEKAWIWQY